MADQLRQELGLYLSAMEPPQVHLMLPLLSDGVRVKLPPAIFALTEPGPLKVLVMTPPVPTAVLRTYLPEIEVADARPAAVLVVGHWPRSA